VETVTIRPSEDIGEIANEFEKELPRVFRYFMRRFGSQETKDQDFISTVMFHRGYIDRLVELGEYDDALYEEQISGLLPK
jgi:NTE family protein